MLKDFNIKLNNKQVKFEIFNASSLRKINYAALSMNSPIWDLRFTYKWAIIY